MQINWRYHLFPHQKARSGGCLVYSRCRSRMDTLAVQCLLLVERVQSLASCRTGHCCARRVDAYNRVFIRAEATGAGLTNRDRVALDVVATASASADEQVAALAAAR